jgi:hypothetical protein
MGSIECQDVEAYTLPPWKILIVGGCYAGLAAAVNLLDLCDARPARFNLSEIRCSSPRRKIPLEITISQHLTQIRSPDRKPSCPRGSRVYFESLGQVRARCSTKAPEHQNHTRDRQLGRLRRESCTDHSVRLSGMFHPI